MTNADIPLQNKNKPACGCSYVTFENYKTRHMKHIKKILFSLTMVILSFILLYVFLIPERQTDKRKQYENFLLSKSSDFYKNQTGKSSKKFDKPEEAAFQDFLMTLDPKLGRVPEDRLYKSYLQTKQFAPKTETIIWENIPVKMGGRSRTLMWDPNDTGGNKVWAGAVTGGLWYNNDITDDNSAWQPVDDFWQSLSVGTMAYDPNNTQIYYIGTGEPETAVTTYRESSGVGIGIYKSSDGGNTWNLLSSSSDFKYITDIVVKNENGISVIYAGVVSGVYQGETQQSTPNDGLYRSADGGTTWTQVLPNIPGETVPYSPSDIELTADCRIFVGSMPNLNEKGAATILFSDTGLNGSWTTFDDYVSIILNNTSDTYTIPGKVKLAAAPSDANIIYAAIASGSDTETVQTFRSWDCRIFLRSDNKGFTWTEKNIPESSWAYLAWHALILKVDPTTPDSLYAGGLDLYKSNDGANSWTHISDWSAAYYGGGDDYVHADQHKIEYKPGNRSEMIFATDGGVFYTSSGTDDYPIFEEKSNNFNTLQTYTCALKPENGSNDLLAGLQDNGTVIHTNDSPVTVDNMIDGGDGAYCFYDKNEPNISISSYYENRYTFYNNYNYVNSGGTYSGTFVSPADYDSRFNKLFANAVTFSGQNQNQILRIDYIPNNPSNHIISVGTDSNVPFSCVRVSPHSPDISTTLFLGTMSGRLFKVEHAGTVPTNIELTGADFPIAAISSISFGETEGFILVTFSNYGVSSVWLTEDGGVTWIEKEGNLPDIPVRWSIVHHQDNQMVMLATELGVWTTDDIRADNVVWNQAINGMANVRVDMLDMRNSDNMILAGTHGRGFYTAYYRAYPESVNDTEKSDITIYPNPSNGIFYINSKNKSQKNYEIYDITGRIVKKGILNNSVNKINLENVKSGNYLIKIGNKTFKLILSK